MVSARTVTAVEAGSPSVSLGNALNVAAVAGVPLFGATNPAELARARFTGDQLLALLPARVFPPKEPSREELDF
jgi:hypothetical protein